jgi:hypothetical protein
MHGQFAESFGPRPCRSSGRQIRKLRSLRFKVHQTGKIAGVTAQKRRLAIDHRLSVISTGVLTGSAACHVPTHMPPEQLAKPRVRLSR